MDTNQDSPHIRAQLEDEGSVLNSNLFLEHVGEVSLTLNSDGLSWKLLESLHNVRFDYVLHYDCLFIYLFIYFCWFILLVLT